MSEYRIKQSPSGSEYRVEFLKETFGSKIKRFIHSLLFDHECKPQPKYKWCLLRDGITNDIADFSSINKAQQIIDKYKSIELDMDYSLWKIVEANKKMEQPPSDP